MAGGSLLTLLDDIATILDDVSVMTKVATQKTVGVLGDDLALNAQQVAGVSADRELPVVWAVAKGSFINKLILVPAALLIAALESYLANKGFNIPITMGLLLIGGLFLCYEGAEKVLHKFAPNLIGQHDDEVEHEAHKMANTDPQVDPVAFSQEKIKGAIRTDFVLSAEIVVIAMGSFADASLFKQALALSIVAVLMTVGVYGLVAVIVKIDDFGVFLSSKPDGFKQKLGKFLLSFAPRLMKCLSVVGTLAMFLVGGGILVHSVPALHRVAEHLAYQAGMLSGVMNGVLNGVLGFVAGLIVVVAVFIISRLKKHNNHNN